MKTTFSVVVLAAFQVFTQAFAGEVVVIGNGNVPRMDAATVQKVFTGKFISVSRRQRHAGQCEIRYVNARSIPARLSQSG